MRISLFKFLVIIGTVGTTAGMWGAYGAGPAIVLVAAIILAWICTSRMLAHWKTSTNPQRGYSIFTAFASVAFSVYVILAITTSPTLDRERSANSLAKDIASDSRFSDVNLRYVERERSVLQVTGSVINENDFWDLNERIIEYDWNETLAIDWNIWIDEGHDAVVDRQIAAADLGDPNANSGFLLDAHRMIQRSIFVFR